MRKLLIVIFVSFGAAYCFMDIAFWSKVNPDSFEKPEDQARMIINTRNHQTSKMAKDSVQLLDQHR